MKKLLPTLSVIVGLLAACGGTTPVGPGEATFTPPPHTVGPSAISLRVEPIIPTDLGDRVTGPATVYVDAPDAVSVEVYVQPVEAPYSEVALGETVLIGADSDPSDGFAVPWAADEPFFTVKLFATADGDSRTSTPIWILLDWRQATATAAAIPTATPAPFAGLPLIVDAADTAGDTSIIADYLAVQGGPSQVGLGYEGDDYDLAAWREIILGAGDLYLFEDTGTYGTHVTREANGQLQIDFNGLDSQVAYHRDVLGTRDLHFSIFVMPRALSSNASDQATYLYYAPTDYDEWRDVVRRTVQHLKNDLGLAGASYLVWNEPETYYYWRGHPGSQPGDLSLLSDYVELYAHTWRAVKEADPTAKVGGPMTIAASIEHVRQFSAGEEGWGTEAFLRELAAYNAAHAESPVTLDEIVWQGYDWTGDLTLTKGAALVREMLAQNGFPPDTPQVVLGWNKQFINHPTPCASISRQQFANFYAANILDQLAPLDGVRGVTRAYLWPFDYDADCPNMALIGIPVPEQPARSEFGGYSQAPAYPAITEYCKRPAYAVFQMLREMYAGGGRFIRVSAAFDSLPPPAAATSNGTQVKLLIANNGETERTFTITFTHLPFGAEPAIGTVQQIDATHSADCSGLEAGSRSRLSITNNQAEISVRMSPDAVVLATLSP